MFFTDNFDATTVQPSQGGTAHPLGMWDAQISNTYAKPTRDKSGGMLVIEFTTSAGRIENRYNLWNDSAQAVEISQKQLSALCHAVNIYRINFPKDAQGNPIMDQAARELRGGRCKIEIVPQMAKNDKGELVPNGYVEVKKVYDSAGNEPGKTGAAPQPMQQTQPPQQQPQPAPGGQPAIQNEWGAPQQPAPQNNAPQGQPGGWGNPPNQPAPNAAPGQAGTGAPPPWGR